MRKPTNCQQLPEHRCIKNTGLDKPVLERYGITMNNMLHGQFGESISDPSVTISSLIRDRFARIGSIGHSTDAVWHSTGVVTRYFSSRV